MTYAARLGSASPLTIFVSELRELRQLREEVGRLKRCIARSWSVAACRRAPPWTMEASSAVVHWNRWRWPMRSGCALSGQVDRWRTFNSPFVRLHGKILSHGQADRTKAIRELDDALLRIRTWKGARIACRRETYLWVPAVLAATINSICVERPTNCGSESSEPGTGYDLPVVSKGGNPSQAFRAPSPLAWENDQRPMSEGEFRVQVR
jgi:hypothetical protein